MKRIRLQLSWLLLLAVPTLAAAFWWWYSSARPPAAETSVAGVQQAAEQTATPRRLDRAPASIRGRIVRAADGAGVEGGVVMLGRAAVVGIAAIEPRVTATGPAGEFSFEDVPPGSYQITASAQGLLPVGRSDLELLPGKEYAELELALTEGGRRAFGTVTDRSGQPIADARVEVTRTIDQQTLDYHVLCTTTDESGQWSIRLKDDHYSVSFVHPDHVRDVSRLIIAGMDRRVDTELIPGAVVSGQVVTREGGKPVPLAEVRLLPPDQIVTQRSTGLAMTRTLADADGNFELRGLPAGLVAISASAEGYGVTEPTQLAVGVAEHLTDIEVLTDRGYTVAGYVVSEDDETQGIAGVVVVAQDFTNILDARSSEASLEDGYFEIHGLLPGHYSLMTMGGDALPSFMKTSVNLTDHDEQNVLIRLSGGTTLRGQVSPPQSVLVSATAAMDPEEIGVFGMTRLFDAMMSTMKVERGNEDGTFTFGPLAAGTYTVELFSPSGMRAQERIEVGDDPLQDRQVQLEPGATVKGHVLEPDGTPVRGVTVAMHAVSETPGLAMSRFSGAGLHEGYTDDEGAFEVRGLGTGEYQYSVRNDMLLRLPWASPDDSESPLLPKTIQIDGDATIDLRVQTAGTLAGVVRDERGRPAPGVWVTAWPAFEARMWMHAIDSGVAVAQTQATRPQANIGDEAIDVLYRQVARSFGRKPVLTDSRGRFEFDDARYDTYTIAAESEHVAERAELAGARPGRDLELTLRPVAGIEGTLAGNAPEGTITITAEGPDWRQAHVRSTAKKFQVQRLMPGDYLLTVEAPGGVRAQEVTVEAGQTIDVDVALGDWGRLSGRLIGLTDHEPLSGLVYQVVRRHASLSEAMAGAGEMVAVMMGRTRARTDEQGRFSIEKLPPGPVTVEFYELPGLLSRAKVRTVLEPEPLDLGDRFGIGLERVPREERGHFGFDLDVMPDSPAEGPLELFVESVAPAGPADKAGVVAGDRILAVDEHSADEVGADTLLILLSSVFDRPGTARKLRLRRGEESLEVTVRSRPVSED